MPSTSRKLICSTGSSVSSSPRSTAAGGARAIHARSINPTCSRAEGEGAAPIGPTVATQQVGQLCCARPMLESVDSTFDFAEASWRQRKAGELAEFQTNLGFLVRVQAISSRTVTGTCDLLPVFQSERDAGRLQCRYH